MFWVQKNHFIADFYVIFMQNLARKYLQFLFSVAPNKAIRTAFELFCTPRKGKVIPKHEDFLQKAKDAYLTVAGVGVQTYRWKNLGETVLLVHGWESNSSRWRSLLKKLQDQKYNVIAFDAPAHGYSGGKILHLPLYTVCVHEMIALYRPDYLIAHSIGGSASLYAQYQFRDTELKKLVILAAPSELKSLVHLFETKLQLSAKFMIKFENYFKKKFGFLPAEFSIAEFAKDIDNKGLLIHDREDAVVPFAASEAIHDNWKNASLLATEGEGHALRSESVEQAILEFLTTA